MEQERTSRRGVLRRVGAGTVGLLGLTGTAAGESGAYIVGTDTPEATRAAQARADAVRRVLNFGDIGRAVAGRFSTQALESLRKRRDVRYVEADGTVRAIHHRDGHDGGPGGGDGGDGGGETTQTLPWGVDRVDADVAHDDGETGAGADVAIVDTGIDSDHPDLASNLGTGKAFVKARGNYAESWDDDNDHGTHCAGIAGAVDNSKGVVGVSTEATLHAVKVLDKNGSGTLSDVAAGIEYVADQGWDVGSMSLGASSGSQTLGDACQYAVDNGVFLVAAAGNSGPCTDCVGYPAAYDTVMAVGSTAEDGSLSGFSSTGPEVEIAAPGSSIYSSVPGGYDTFSGTSMACPHVAGAAGQLAADGSSNDQIRSQLTSTAEDIGLASNESGAGLLDVAAALELDSSS